MDEEIVALYCLGDDLLKAQQHREDPQCQMSDAQLYWRRDVIYDGDRSQVRSGTAPHVLAMLRNVAIGWLLAQGETNLAAAHRAFAAHPENALPLLGIQRE